MTAASPSAEFMDWYAPFHDRFMKYCASQTFGLASAEDIAQDAVLSALEQWNRLEDKDRLLAYMIGIVNHRVRNQLRSARVQQRYLQERRRHLSDRLPAQPELALDLHYLLRAIDLLPEQSKEALLLTAVSGWSIREVADIQQSTPGAVKTRISRARKELREKFAEDGKPLRISERLTIYASLLL
ncbi:RNA polymerase sigma-70 factor (ECF subfamily) [Neolewinella xylanilytica]|uniref:RNA polymerase sigma-70 factor (ECF subfamily) n=1 Tax=Neolewinella xylanilytica TaxID=1514080 RepID=A0A2S6I7W5_9BACT|nr:RNA polymerase sigma factor [Neolewinella xylanilytica]PPK87587.1 RNA polymerase sigma-70 factor (ECF subfamily) [Neolewinella xylanilytica]